MATPVSPSSAALRNVSRGKWPVSSSSLASGFTSASANSRTVRWSSFCSSVSSKFTNQLLDRIERSSSRRKCTAAACPACGGFDFPGQALRAAITSRYLGPGLRIERVAKLFVSCLEFFGLDASFSYGSHEICIAGPARQDVKMQMPGHARSGCAPKIHSEIVALRMIDPFEGRLDLFRERLGIGCREIGDVNVGDDHDVAGRVRKPIQDDEILFAAKNDVGAGIIACGDRIAENAAVIFCRGDVT